MYQGLDSEEEHESKRMKRLENENTNRIILMEDLNHVDSCNPFLQNSIQQCRRFVLI